MDFSQIFSIMQNKNNSNSGGEQSFEDKVSSQSKETNQQQSGNQNNMLEKLLPLLASGQNLDNESLIKMLGGGNSQMNGLMSVMPLLQKQFGNLNPKKQSKKKYEYVKITDYYKK